MGVGNVLKRWLRRFIPAGRTYIDHKFQEQNEELRSLLLEQNKKIAHLEKTICDMKRDQKNMAKEFQSEWKRRDQWAKRPKELKRLAKGKELWVIKCPSPDDDTKIRWGDYHYAMSLKKYLERLDRYVVIDSREDWDSETGADVVLVLRGCMEYRPDRRNKKCRYIMWNISHPDMVSVEEYELYDLICVGSIYYAEQLRNRLSVPVVPLLQCTDTEIFYPDTETKTDDRQDYVFIGNSRGIARSCVMWAIEDQLPIRIWGSGWNKILKDHMELVEAPFIENSDIPRLYRSAKVTLNDHWEDMLKKQYVNNRIFDALACGLPVISDGCDELKEIFPTAVLYYSSHEEFEACVVRIEQDYDAVRKEVLNQWEMIKEKYSFEVRARELVELVSQTR